MAEFAEVTPDNAIGLCNTLRTIFKDFVDRIDDSVPVLKTRWAMWGWTILMVAIASTSTFWAYAISSHAWQLQFAYPFGASLPALGKWVEVFRSVVLAAMMLYLLEVTFRTESGRFFDLTRASLWRSKLVIVTRIAMLVLTVVLVRSIILYHLDDAPKH